MRIAKKNNRLKKNMGSLMYLCDNIKLISIHVLVEPAGKKRKCKRCTNEILAKHLKETAIQV